MSSAECRHISISASRTVKQFRVFLKNPDTGLYKHEPELDNEDEDEEFGDGGYYCDSCNKHFDSIEEQGL